MKIIQRKYGEQSFERIYHSHAENKMEEILENRYNELEQLATMKKGGLI